MTVTIEELSGIEPDLRWMPMQGEVTADFLKRKALAGEASSQSLRIEKIDGMRNAGRGR